MVNIGARIRRVRQHYERTQEEFAAFIGGVERGAVGNWELGRSPSLENLYKISKKTRVPMEWFMAGPDDMPIPFLNSPANEIARIATEPILTQDEAVSLLSIASQEFGAARSEVEATILSRAVLRAYRKPPESRSL
jgi:transcriptional regulator with XRE-family HTH domain